MDEQLLREVANGYLLPFFTGATLEPQSEASNRRQKLVAFRNPQQIAFKAEQDDTYRLLLNRSQYFAQANGPNLPEIAVIQAFVDALNPMILSLGTNLKRDLLSTFQRRVVARALKGFVGEVTILSGIDLLAHWASRLYEGAPISAAIGFTAETSTGPSVELHELEREDFAAVLTNGLDTMMEFDANGRFLHHLQLNQTQNAPSFCPLRHAPIAEWTAADARRTALSLNRLGEILVFRSKQMLFARRSGRWFFLTHDPIISQMSVPQDRDLRSAIYETCLDASFSRTGACIGVVALGHWDSWQDLVQQADQLENSRTVKAKALKRIVGNLPFQSIDRRLRQELTAIDGATILDHNGKVLAIGAILKIPAGSSGGGRRAAAIALGKKGLGVKVSQDGGITGFLDRSDSPVFNVM